MTSPDPITALVDLETERLALGHMLGFNAYPLYELAGFQREQLYRAEHATIFDAICALSDAGVEADLVSTAQHLRACGKFHEQEIQAAYFAQLIDGVPKPSPPQIARVVSRLMELAAGRKVWYAAQRVQGRLMEPDAVADGALTSHLDTIQAILEQHRGRGAAWLDVEAQVIARQREIESAHTGARTFFGLPALDEVIGGVRAGEVCGLMGRPGIGKTIFLSAIARSASESAGHIFFSLEMPASQIVGRLRQMLYNLGRFELEDQERAGQIDDAKYLRAFNNLVIVDTPSLSVAEMSRLVRQIANGPLKHTSVNLVTIDHLGLIGGDRALSTYDRVSVQAREVKELAKRMDCAVMLAVQVNRDAGGDGSKELGLGSARDSGVVEEAMDYLIGIRRLDRSLTLSTLERERYRDVIFAKVIKNRHGDPGINEIAYRMYPIGLALQEDTEIRIDADDIGRIAQGKRR